MIITVVNNKGGVGKSTTAIHLAKYLGRHRGPTTLVDGDNNGTALTWFRDSQEKDFTTVSPEVSATTEYIVIDAQARPSQEDIKALARFPIW